MIIFKNLSKSVFRHEYEYQSILNEKSVQSESFHFIQFFLALFKAFSKKSPLSFESHFFHWLSTHWFFWSTKILLLLWSKIFSINTAWQSAVAVQHGMDHCWYVSLISLIKSTSSGKSFNISSVTDHITISVVKSLASISSGLLHNAPPLNSFSMLLFFKE